MSTSGSNDSTIFAYVNGKFVPESEAAVSIFDRGFLFADGIYEVTSVLRGKLIDNPGHVSRLNRSLAMMQMRSPVSDEEIVAIEHELVARNRLEEGTVYLQITRGAAPRDFAFPQSAEPTLIMFTQSRALIDSPIAERGIKVITAPEIRWQKRDIKTVGLLAASMGKQAALDVGADDTWFVEDGQITEGTANNAWIVTRDGALVTRQLGSEILPGVTRKSVLALCEEQDMEVQERPFTVAEAHQAAEAFSTSASSFVMPVVQIDAQILGDGTPGAITRRLRQLYIETSLASVA